MCCSLSSTSKQPNLSNLSKPQSPHFTCRFRWLINTYTHISVHFIYQCLSWRIVEAMLMLMSALRTPPRLEQPGSSVHIIQSCSSQAAGGAHYTGRRKSQRVNFDTQRGGVLIKKPIQLHTEATLLFTGRISLDMGFVSKSTTRA